MRDHRALPAFQHVHELVLAVHEAVGRLPGGEAGALGARMEAAAHSAAAAVARACAVPGEQFGGQIDEASRRVREVGYYIDIAQRMGYPAARRGGRAAGAADARGSGGERVAARRMTA